MTVTKTARRLPALLLAIASSACGSNSNSNCSWVDGYKRKDGAKVKAH